MHRYNCIYFQKTPSLLAESKTSAEEKAKHRVISTEAKLCEPCDRKTNEIQTASGKQSSELLLVAKSKSHITKVRVLKPPYMG